MSHDTEDQEDFPLVMVSDDNGTTWQFAKAGTEQPHQMVVHYTVVKYGPNAGALTIKDLNKPTRMTFRPEAA